MTSERVAIDAKSPFEARVLRAVLAAAGIEAEVEGDLLADEVAMSEALTNRRGVRVWVPRAQQNEAMLAIEAARRSARDLPTPDVTTGPWTERYRQAVRVFLIVLCIALLTFGAQVIQALYW